MISIFLVNDFMDMTSHPSRDLHAAKHNSLSHIRPSSALRSKTLDFAVSDKVRSNDTPFVIAAVSRSGWQGRGETWQFVKNNYPLWLER